MILNSTETTRGPTSRAQVYKIFWRPKGGVRANPSNSPPPPFPPPPLRAWMVLPILRLQARNMHIVCTDPCPHGLDGPNVKESYGDLRTSRFRILTKQLLYEVPGAPETTDADGHQSPRVWTWSKSKFCSYARTKANTCSDVLGPKNHLI